MPTEPLIPLGKEGGVYTWERTDVPDDHGLDLDHAPALDLGLGIPLLPAAAPCVQSGSVVASHSVEICWEIFFPAFLRPCASQRPPDG
jgi:hypothetical protein